MNIRQVLIPLIFVVISGSAIANTDRIENKKPSNEIASTVTISKTDRIKYEKKLKEIVNTVTADLPQSLSQSLSQSRVRTCDEIFWMCFHALGGAVRLCQMRFINCLVPD